MKELYIECNMGVAGDMLCGALLDTLSDAEQKDIIKKFNTFLDGVSVSIKKDTKLGISGTKFNVKIEEKGHHHTNINEINTIIDSFDISNKVKDNAKNIYQIIAKAESKVHNTDVSDIHLHEVGAKDAIIDIVTCCYLIEYIGIEKVECSPIVTGFGEIGSAHGILPIPAPATAEILCGIKTETGNIRGELTTPTGAGLIKYFASNITNEKPSYNKIGYGIGTKDFEKANCVRVFINENKDETVYELKCQIDDMTGEEMGYAITKLLSVGALDAFVTLITMKKSRPAFEFCIISTPKDKKKLTNEIFKHTTTLGIREIVCKRDILTREIFEKNNVHIKKSTGYGTTKEKIEFDDLAKIADEKDISILEARRLVK